MRTTGKKHSHSDFDLMDWQNDIFEDNEKIIKDVSNHPKVNNRQKKETLTEMVNQILLEISKL